MKTIALGDIHGRQIWKDIIQKEGDADRIIFIGDYVDSFDVPGIDQLQNLLNIIEFKTKSSKEVILLIGNHDYQYMNNGCQDRYSGFQATMRPAFNEVFTEHEKLFQMCFEDEYKNVYTHAGLTETFVTQKIGSYSMQQVNDVFFHRPSTFKFSPLDHSGCGDSIESSCIWVRPDSLYRDSINRFQIVGHTTVNKINHPAKSNRRGFYLIDCLQQKQYLSCIDGVFKPEQL